MCLPFLPSKQTDRHHHPILPALTCTALLFYITCTAVTCTAVNCTAVLHYMHSSYMHHPHPHQHATHCCYVHCCFTLHAPPPPTHQHATPFLLFAYYTYIGRQRATQPCALHLSSEKHHTHYTYSRTSLSLHTPHRTQSPHYTTTHKHTLHQARNKQTLHTEQTTQKHPHTTNNRRHGVWFIAWRAAAEGVVVLPV